MADKKAIYVSLFWFDSRKFAAELAISQGRGTGFMRATSMTSSVSEI